MKLEHDKTQNVLIKINRKQEIKSLLRNNSSEPKYT